MVLIISAETWARPLSSSRRYKVVKAAKSMLSPEFGRKEASRPQELKVAQVQPRPVE